ncbi:hypothetical protein EHS25_008975 [Saitozyma podzolica]|uniref:Gfo/Idh/MocA-like oxidoreductase N-terminal domain-containing protein n=1 Tax=Saitozyma podzolica TaxID=1890683 RepID=A0A427YKK6_9TREE|nr:hypothetical protein EHS25_008975 [Saitozyma podzolica]
MPGPILNVAVLGCGEVAQCVHLPTLLFQSDRYKAVALCDISQQSLRHCGSRFHIPEASQFADLAFMLESSLSIDLVVILTADQYHAEQVIQCADAGTHVLIEKPMAQTFPEAEAIEEARKRNGVVIFVGYMRRFAPALALLKADIEGKQIRYVRVRDIIGKNPFFTSQAGMFLKYFHDFPPGASAELAKRKRANAEEVLARRGLTRQDEESWVHLGCLGSHDLSAMRDVLGMPRKCSFASRSGEESPKWWSAIFDYGDFNALYEMAIDNVAIFDAHIEIYTDDSRVKVQYDTPFVKGLPIKLTIQKNLENGAFSEQVIRPTYIDPYTIEYGKLYEAIVNGNAYKTTPSDAQNDLMLSNMIMEALVE